MLKSSQTTQSKAQSKAQSRAGFSFQAKCSWSSLVPINTSRSAVCHSRSPMWSGSGNPGGNNTKPVLNWIMHMEIHKNYGDRKYFFKCLSPHRLRSYQVLFRISLKVRLFIKIKMSMFCCITLFFQLSNVKWFTARNWIQQWTNAPNLGRGIEKNLRRA